MALRGGRFYRTCLLSDVDCYSDSIVLSDIVVNRQAKGR